MSSLSGRSRATGVLACAMLAAFHALIETTTHAQVVQGFFERSLKSIPVPEPTDLNDYIADREAAIRLGKALFWDVRLGTDGVTACATCHHQAGVDSRLTNIAHPGADGSFSSGFAPGARAAASHFPTTKFANPADRLSTRIQNLDDVAGSPGILKSTFVANGENADLVTIQPDSVFTSADGQQRQVTARNAPSVINAAFYVRQFWDGRANAWFNGVNPFGTVDPNAKVWKVNPKTGEPSQVSILLNHASLASQAVGPVNNAQEMAAHGRGWVDVARKLLDSRALATQKVSSTDSMLGPIANPKGTGLTATYRQLIEQAFQPAWRSNALTPSGASVTEENMSLFFGLAVQLYEMTLISDDSRYDQWIELDGPLGLAPGLLSDAEIRGLRLFFNLDQQLDPLTTTPETNCRECHVSPAFSVATYGGKGTGLVGLPGRGVYPNAPDTDNDGFPNHIDALPNNQYEWVDTDRDGIGNNADIDDDGDGIFDAVDPFPLDADNLPDEPPVTPGPFAPLPIAIMEDLPGGILIATTFEEPPVSAEPGARLLDFPINGGGIDLYDPYGNLLTHVPLAGRSIFPCNFSYHIEKPFADIGPFASFIVDASTLNCRYSLTLELQGFPVGDYPFKIDGVLRGTLRSLPFRMYDEGFYNLGVRPMGEDAGVAGTHPNGVPLSATNRLVGGHPMTEFGVVPGALGLSPAVANSFKTPSLRNVELTGPFFHNGGVASLEDVIRFYNRGGDFHENNLDTLAPSMHNLNLTEAHISDLAAFLRTLTDERVRDAKAPFDHPALPLPDGSAIAAVGEAGRSAACATAMYTFEQALVVEDLWFGDCDRNGLVDSCEIARAPELDADADGTLDACATPCPADITGDGSVVGDDLALLLAAWGMPAAKAGGADVNADGTVGGGDLALLLGSWGACP